MPLTLRGAPQKLDLVLRPVVRAALALVGLLGTATLALLGAWWWAPLPLAGALLLHEAIFALRADRPIRVGLGERLTVVDPKRGLRFELDPAAVTVATAQRRLADGDRADLRVVLADDDGVRAALWLRVPRAAPPLPFEVQADLTDRVIGGDFGSLRALAPADRIARQRVDAGEDAIAWLRARIPAEAWRRTGARVWRGAEPPLDLLGHHVDEPSGFLVLDGATARLGGREIPLRWASEGRSVRVAVLFDPGQPDPTAADALPLLRWSLGDGLALAVPSRILGHEGERIDLTEDTLHTHPAEAAALLSHLLRMVDTGAWPEDVSNALAEARVLLPG